MINNKLFYGPEAYVSLETAKLLKEAGFDWEIDTFYHRYYEGDGHDDCTPTEEFYFDVNRSWIHDWNNDALTYVEKTGELVHLSAPTISIAQKWFREVKEMHISIDFTFITNEYIVSIHWRANDSSKTPFDNEHTNVIRTTFKTHEEAQEEGIQHCLHLILDNEKKEN